MKKIVLFLLLLLTVFAVLTACVANEKGVTPEESGSGTADAIEDETETVEFYGHESEYELTFYDDFDGTALDTAKWSYCPDWERGNVGGRWDKSMISLDGEGNLVVKSDYIENEDGSVTPISGAIRTDGKFEQCKGFFEIRCKLQSAKGFWFAFWLMCDGEKSKIDGIKNGAEMDIVEAFDLENGLVNHALHWDGYDSDMKSINRVREHKDCYDGEYHTFSLLWDDNGYIFYVDGKASSSILKKDPSFPGVCEVPTYLKITSEFGTWSSMYDINELPDAVYVDYVKVYARKD